MRFVVALIACGAVFTATPLLAQQAKTGKDSGGKSYLQTPSDMTLYVFDGDGKNGGSSSCYDQCAKAWPPFTATADASPKDDWTVVKRTDGSQQWAYKGRPLYTFAKDSAAGQQNGNSFDGNKWHVAQP